ncbi:Essential recombination function protein [uncultured Caudovirales phage]|uniref:Essential recombination function protein n=1 Tax=uncultured Caudovirales phage TaxID=2100421 RepID=A0A6J5MYL7_9CAUD|nr:Essential recombination function protein [uncultured Caudovirales phage]
MKIYAKLHEAKKEIGVVKKNAKNPHFKNTYADLNALIDAVEPILLEKGLIMLQPIKDGKVFTQIIDIDTFDMIESFIDLSPNLTAQALGSQITYYRRYQISAILSLMADDDDGHKASAPQPISKEILQVGSTNFIRCIDALKEGKGTIEQIKAKYNVSSEVEKLLIEKSK